MILSFVAPGLAVVPIPGLLASAGSPAKRLSMKFVGATNRKGTPGYAPVERPQVVDQELAPQLAASLIRMVQKGTALPLDEQTAKAAGVRFTRLKWSAETGYVPAATSAPTTKKGGG